MARGNKKPRVLLTGAIDWAHGEWNALSEIATLEVCNVEYEEIESRSPTRTIERNSLKI